VSQNAFKDNLMRGSLVGLAVAAATTVLASNASAVVLRSQSTCNPSGSCIFVEGPENSTSTVRSFSFSLPTGGVARLAFEGSMLCTVKRSSTAAPRVIDVVGQITASPTAEPNASQEGGFRLARTYVPIPSASITDTFNLSTNRSLGFIQGGQYTVQMRMDLLRLDAGVRCDLYNLSFSVLLEDFVPAVRE
jgi:hypothetical protein